MNVFYFCERYAFKTEEVKIGIDDFKLFDFQWPRRSEHHFKGTPVGAMAVIKSSVPGSDFTILVKSKTNKLISLELVTFYNEYRIFVDDKVILKGEKINFKTACSIAFNKIKRRYKCFFISPPKKVLTPRIQNNLGLLSETWLKFLEEAGSKYWGYVDDLNLSSLPKHNAVLCSSPWFYCENILEVRLVRSRNRLRIKIVKGTYVARCRELRFNLWHTESPWPLIDRFLKYYASYLSDKPNNFIESTPELPLNVAVNEVKTFLCDKFWGNVITDHQIIETCFDKDIWTEIKEKACVIYNTETEVPQYLFTVYTDYSKYQVVYNPTGYLVKRSYFKDASKNIFNREVRINSLNRLRFDFLHRSVPSLKQLCRARLNPDAVPSYLKKRFFNFEV
ncbi:hypothetical protein LCDVSa125R [Lymphocystis disease virus 3]|uniref:Uncharacterized protein n=1 Tax=Lymphocystis disease virus 3 TaxID=2560566 RepID=A0A1B2RW41_9VIRU|nr:hypothetical protein BZK12_gp125 [Lymphocystis disease virus Sa]AOC55209.1 hypothetical protein LCDVSa125R [Lymphocystis disease virus 3]